MRDERAKDIVRLAMRLQGSRGGMTLDDVRPNSPSAGGQRSACATRSMKPSDR